MTIETVAIISPGDMGHMVGKVIRGKGFRVITSLLGRSALSCARAERSGMEDVGSLRAVLQEADAVLSIMPPERAFSFANAAAGVVSKVDQPVFADCNAISPATTEKMREVVAVSGMDFVKIGIVGPPPEREGCETRFYAAGPAVETLAFLDGGGIKYQQLGAQCGQAAAIKMCYAALTKGTMTLHTAVLTTAELLGVSDVLHHELEASQAFHWDMMNKRVPFYPADAGRWAGEMDEISETFVNAGVSGNLHKGAADIFRMLDKTPLAAESRETVDKSRTLDQAIAIYAETVKSGK
ncbi:MAG: DUF1932 domain-containing protein [Rhodospirillales bacterium]|nr:DUF1932 domain-containing protein [Rhodospirillales bacterium]